jgi:ribosomal protein S18 acetylase RimI-like enzyme
MHVVRAVEADFLPWLQLAAEVEPLFGPMVNEPVFHSALNRCIGCGTAWCVRTDAGQPGSVLLGGILYSERPALCHIEWLAVRARARRAGVGRMLVLHLLSLMQTPCQVELVTFASGIPEGRPARLFYQRLGFEPAELGPETSHGMATQVFRMKMEPNA